MITVIHTHISKALQNTAGRGAAPNNRNKKVMFKNCASSTNCISWKNNTQSDDIHDTNVVMPVYNLILYET